MKNFLNTASRELVEKINKFGHRKSFTGNCRIFSEGETMEEARTNLADALKLVTEYHRDEARSRASASAVRESHLMVAS